MIVRLLLLLLFIVVPASAVEVIPNQSGPGSLLSIANVQNVVTSGALCDGVTDNTTAFTNAFTASRGVWVPPCTAGFAVVGPVNIPADSMIFGAGDASRIIHTGTGDLFRLNFGGALTFWRATIAHLLLTSPGSAASVAIRLVNTAEVRIEGVTVLGTAGVGFGTAAIVLDGTSGPIVTSIIGNRFVSNGSCLLTAGAGTSHNQLAFIGNRCQGSNTTAGIGILNNGDSWAIVGNDIEGNTGNEISLTATMIGMVISGNHFETTANANNGISLAPAATKSLQGISITGNKFLNGGGAPTGSAIVFNSAGAAYIGIHVKGNWIQGYGAAVNAAIVFNTAVISESDFSGNAFDPSVTLAYGALPAATSNGVIRRVLGVVVAANLGAPAAVPGQSASGAITITGALVGDRVHVACDCGIPTNFLLQGQVTAANTVTFTWTQIAGAATDPDGPGGSTYRITVIQ